jgi:hypothetical protein
MIRRDSAGDRLNMRLTASSASEPRDRPRRSGCFGLEDFVRMAGHYSSNRPRLTFLILILTSTEHLGVCGSKTRLQIGWPIQRCDTSLKGASKMEEAKPRVLEFANFTLNFGKDKVLADLWKEVVQPAFLDESLERKYGDTTYFFLQAQELNLGSKKEMVPAIAGRFVKDFVLRREQTFDPDSSILNFFEHSSCTSEKFSASSVRTPHPNPPPGVPEEGEIGRRCRRILARQIDSQFCRDTDGLA